jgi:hypothetical protein
MMRSGLKGKSATSVIVLVLGAMLGLVGCAPRTVAEAERRGDVAWLDTEGSGEAVAALGRLADKDPQAVQVLDARAATDVNAYIAGWAAILRGASWGAATLRTGLGSPARAEETASVMARRDPHLIPFIPDLEGALVRLAASKHNTAIAAVAREHVGAERPTRRSPDASPTARRAAPSVSGIGSPDAQMRARASVLMKVPTTSRDDELVRRG